MFSQSLAALAVKPLPQSADAVEAGRLSRLRGHPVRALILIGMSDKPGKSAAGLLSDMESRRLAETPGVWLAPDSLSHDMLNAIDIKSALALARERVIAVYPMSDAEREAAYPGALPEWIRRIFPNVDTPGGIGGDDDMRRMELETPAAAIVKIAPALRGANGKPDLLTGAALSALRAMPNWREETGRMMKAPFHRVSSDPIGSRLARALYMGPRSASVSRLESYAACPFKHFAHYGLRPLIIEPFEFSPRDRGVFFHDSLELYLSRAGERLGAMSAIDSQGIIDAVTSSLLDPVMEGPAGESPVILSQYARMRQIARRAARAVERQFEDSAFINYSVELSFNEHNPVISAGEDSIPLSGRIDRIDQWRNQGENRIRVVDYKTGRQAFNMTEFSHGLRFQLMVYLAAALRRAGGKPAGAFYFRVEDPVISTYETDCDAVEREREKLLRLDGVMSSDRKVLDAMSPDPAGVVRISINKDGSLNKSALAFSDHDLAAMLSYALREAGKTVNGIRNGVTGILPVMTSPAKSPCRYCDYAALCQIDPKLPGGQGRILPKLSKSEAIGRILAES